MDRNNKDVKIELNSFVVKYIVRDSIRVSEIVKGSLPDWDNLRTWTNFSLKTSVKNLSEGFSSLLFTVYLINMSGVIKTLWVLFCDFWGILPLFRRMGR